MKNKRGFTLIELLVVISIISLLSSIVIASLAQTRDKAYYARALIEFKNIATAVELYRADNNGKYPGDTTGPGQNARGQPPDEINLAGKHLVDYISGGNWPSSPWPWATYDWDYWDNSDSDVNNNISCKPKTPIAQISIRFCPSPYADHDADSKCRFPNLSWVVTTGPSKFDSFSSLYYCISGPCRSHNDQVQSYPGHCAGGDCPTSTFVSCNGSS